MVDNNGAVCSGLGRAQLLSIQERKQREARIGAIVHYSALAQNFCDNFKPSGLDSSPSYDWFQNAVVISSKRNGRQADC